MAKAVKFTKENIDRIIAKVRKPQENSLGFFVLLNAKLDQWTQIAFRAEGLRGGNPKWPSWNRGRGFNILGGTTLTKAGTRKIRYGTDLSAKWPKNIGRPALKRGTTGFIRTGVRRYTGSSKMLQASGGFRRSFGRIRVRKEGLNYGTTFNLAEKIMSSPTRQVLFITPQDEKEIMRMWLQYNSRLMQL